MTLPTSDFLAALLAQPADADRLMRAACAELRQQPPALVPPQADALRAGLARIADSGLDTVLQRLLQNLLEEDVSIRDMRTILDTLAEHAGQNATLVHVRWQRSSRTSGERSATRPGALARSGC